MQAINFIVITSAVLCLSSAKTNIVADESLTYECTRTTVIITGKNATNYGSIFAVGTNGTSNSSECSVNRTIQNKSAKFEISGCIVTKPITVIIMQEKQTWTQHDMVIGGQLTAEYELQCNDVYLGGVTMNKTFNLSKVEDMEVDKGHHQPTFTLSMMMQTTNHQRLNDKVLIGTDLLLVITGTHGFLMHPQSCVASSLTNLTGHVKPLITNGVADDPMIMTNFSNQTNDKSDNKTDIIEAHLYAFHFLDSNTIYLECIVSVCQIDDKSCPALSSSTTKIPAHSSLQTKTGATGTPQTASPTTKAGASTVKDTQSSSTKITTTVASTVASTSKKTALVGRRKRNIVNMVPHKHTVGTILRVVDNNALIENTPVSSSASGVSSLWTASTLICLALKVARH